jgi:ferredoxin
MPKIIVLPHADLCPQGALFDAEPGLSICDNLLNNQVDIEHACEMSCACTTCHVVIREGFASLEPSDELEDDLLHCYQKQFGYSYEELDQVLRVLGENGQEAVGSI